MRRLIFPILFAVISIILAPAAVLNAAEADPATPTAVLPEPGYVFDSVPEGIDVLHDFPIQNTGTAILNIEKVKTG